MASQYPIDSPPELLAPPVLRRREDERSAVREAIVAVCETAVGERGCRLQALLDKIEKESGAKAAFDSIIKLLEFSQPKLQRVTVEDPSGNAVQMPVFNITLGGAGVKLVELDGEVREDGD